MSDIMEKHEACHAAIKTILDTSELLKTVDHEFCVRMMDSGAAATRIACTSIQDLLLNDGIVVDDIILMSNFSTQLTRDPNRTQFNSGTCLYVVKTKQNRTVAILYTNGSIEEGP